jgi:hypothetical protein
MKLLQVIENHVMAVYGEMEISGLFELVTVISFIFQLSLPMQIKLQLITWEVIK